MTTPDLLLGLAAIGAAAAALGAAAGYLARERTPRWRMSSGIAWPCDQPPRAPAATLRPMRRPRPASRAAVARRVERDALIRRADAARAAAVLASGDLDARHAAECGEGYRVAGRVPA